MNQVRKELRTFLVILIAASVVCNGLLMLRGGGMANNIPLALGLMFSPALAALIARFAHQKNLKGLGWGWAQARYFAAGYGIPLAYIGITYGLVLATGLGGVDKTLLAATGPLEVAQFFVFNVLIGCLIVIGEEIGWRGFFLPQLCKIMSFTKASMVVGLVWVLAHYPVLIFADYNTNGTPLWYSLVCFTILALGANMVMNWLRIKSGSLWPVLLFHAAHNSFLQDLNPYIVRNNLTPYFISEFGALLALAGLVLGLVFWKKRGELSKEMAELR